MRHRHHGWRAGKVHGAYFDDERWTVLYLVADVGSWLRGRKVLISPHAVARIDPQGETVETQLTRAPVDGSLSVETDHPLSGRLEAEYNRYYGFAACGYGAFIRSVQTWREAQAL